MVWDDTEVVLASVSRISGFYCFTGFRGTLDNKEHVCLAHITYISVYLPTYNPGYPATLIILNKNCDTTLMFSYTKKWEKLKKNNKNISAAQYISLRPIRMVWLVLRLDSRYRPRLVIVCFFHFSSSAVFHPSPNYAKRWTNSWENILQLWTLLVTPRYPPMAAVAVTF